MDKEEKMVHLRPKPGTLLDMIYVCEITKALDVIKNPDKEVSLDYYVYIDSEIFSKTNTVFIRIPGHTVGSIEVDDSFTIKNITINEDDIEKGVFLKDVNEELSRFIGMEIEKSFQASK